MTEGMKVTVDIDSSAPPIYCEIASRLHMDPLGIAPEAMRPDEQDPIKAPSLYERLMAWLRM